MKTINSQNVSPDGFDPVGSVRIAGKRVFSDDPKATFPGDADWLIWERSGDSRRLCKMQDGRWSVCGDAPRNDAPKIIVINNDADTVFLSYTIGIDYADVEGTMKKIVDVLRKRGILEKPQKIKTPIRTMKKSVFLNSRLIFGATCLSVPGKFSGLL